MATEIIRTILGNRIKNAGNKKTNYIKKKIIRHSQKMN